MATLPILGTVKEYLRVLDDSENLKITDMIVRARLWVEDHTGLSLLKREFTEQHTLKGGLIRLLKGPLVAVLGEDATITYLDGAVINSYVARTFAPSSVLHPATGGSFPTLEGGMFTVTYTAGFEVGAIDDRLIGAMLALIEGEFSEGYAYPDRAVSAAANCCNYLRTITV